MNRRPAVFAIAALSATAGVVHAAVAFRHVGSASSLDTAFFAAAAVYQLAWAALVAVRPERRVLTMALPQAALVAVWLWSRTIGVPVGGHAGEVLPARPLDTVTALAGAGALAGAMWLRRADRLRAVGQRAHAGLRVAVLLAVVPLTVGVVGMALASDHGTVEHDSHAGHHHDDAHHEHAGG